MSDPIRIYILSCALLIASATSRPQEIQTKGNDPAVEFFSKPKTPGPTVVWYREGRPSLPYRPQNHPLFRILKDRLRVLDDRHYTVRLRNGHDGVNDVATLILKPVARAIAGNDGRAIAMPLSRAVLRKGTDADILFEPESIAIAGPGGIAHAQSDLEISYEE